MSTSEPKNQFKLKWYIGISLAWLLVAGMYCLCNGFLDLKLENQATVFTALIAPIALLGVYVGLRFQHQELSAAISQLSQQTEAQSSQAKIANDALQYQMDEARKKDHVAWRAMQPSFVLSHSTGSSIGMKVNVGVTKNNIYNVRVRAEPPFREDLSGGNRLIGNVPAGSDFHILVPEPIKENLPHDWIVTYDDNLGYEADVRIEVKSTGEYHVHTLTSGPIAASTGRA